MNVLLFQADFICSIISWLTDPRFMMLEVLLRLGHDMDMIRT